MSVCVFVINFDHDDQGARAAWAGPKHGVDRRAAGESIGRGPSLLFVLREAGVARHAEDFICLFVDFLNFWRACDAGDEWKPGVWKPWFNWAIAAAAGA